MSLCGRTFSKNKNRKFVVHLLGESRAGRWRNVAELVLASADRVIKEGSEEKHPKGLVQRWSKLRRRASDIRKILRKGVASLFSFVGGALTSAARDGDWVLLDEVNLGSPEALLALGDLFSGAGSLRLHDGAGTCVPRHPGFRLFCCMNPSTDVGKREPPAAFSSRVARCHVDEPAAEADLAEVVARYLPCLPEERARRVVRFYRAAREAARTRLCDGAGRRPCYSLRTLCRALRIVAANYDGSGNALDRCLVEGLSACFLTELDRPSYDVVLWLIFKIVADKSGKDKGLVPSMKAPLRMPAALKGKRVVQIEGYWLPCGEGDINVQVILTRFPRIERSFF